MTRAGGFLAAVLVALGLVVSVGPLAGPATACSCVAQDAAGLVAAADAVFVGTLADHDLDERRGVDVGTFVVEEVRKGTLPERPVVATRTDTQGACGGGPWEQGRYLVHASDPALHPQRSSFALPGQLETNGCGFLQRAGADAPSASPAPSPDNPEGVDGPLLLLSFTTVAAIVGFLLIVRRHRRRMREAELLARRRRRPRG